MLAALLTLSAPLEAICVLVLNALVGLALLAFCVLRRSRPRKRS